MIRKMTRSGKCDEMPNFLYGREFRTIFPQIKQLSDIQVTVKYIIEHATRDFE